MPSASRFICAARSALPDALTRNTKRNLQLQFRVRPILMPRQSAGLLMYRWREDRLEVFLVHPGGPFWSKKDFGAWSIPKGEYAEGEEPLAAARREFQEETGFAAEGEFLALGSLTQTSGKVVSAWAFEGDCNPDDLISNTCEVEWPPRSGRRIEIPEVDRGAWFSLDAARDRIVTSQAPLLGLLSQKLSVAKK
jgi:predicted NUDIX family NTP pyrophosphohydrolase